MLKNYAKKSWLLVILAIAVYCNYLFIHDAYGLEKIFGYAFAVLILVPIIAHTLAFFLIPSIDKPKANKPSSRQYNTDSIVNQSNTVSRLQEINKKKVTHSPTHTVTADGNIIPIASNKFKSKQIEDDTYDAIRNILIACSKNKLFSREDILTILSYLNYKLGTSQFHYSNFNFQNEMHEIYTKLKNKHLTNLDYQDILKQVETITNNITKEDSQCKTIEQIN